MVNDNGLIKGDCKQGGILCLSVFGVSFFSSNVFRLAHTLATKDFIYSLIE